jgi:hypothetical protein
MRRRLVPVIALALLVPVAGCSDDRPTAGPTEPTSATPTTDGSATPTPAPTQSPGATPTSAPTPDPSPAADIADLLLPAADLPGLTDSWSWSEGATTSTSQKVGACSRLAMDSLGAERSVVRRYLPTGDETGGTAVHEVSQFVDERSVRQARAIFTTWHDQCAARVPGARVGPVTDVITPAGFGTWYLVTQRAAGGDRNRYRMLGILSSGTTVELVEMDLTARTFGYAPRNEPVVGAVDAAAGRLA